MRSNNKLANFRLAVCLFGLENDIKAFSGSRVKVFWSAATFSCGSGVRSRCTRVQQKYLGGALDLSGSQWFLLSVFFVGMPSGTIGLDGITHEQ